MTLGLGIGTGGASSIWIVAASGADSGIGKCRHIAALAQGGMADVYLAITQNVVQTLEVGTDEATGRHFIAMDYAHELRDFDGTPLHVVRRDVSAQKVMLTFTGAVEILDFGIAKAALAAEQRPEDSKGKLEYMAPDQAESAPDVDRPADIFSVGEMLWESLTRQRLYRKDDPKLDMLRRRATASSTRRRRTSARSPTETIHG